MEKTYQFTVDMIGRGETPEEAWRDCQEHFEIGMEDQPTPEKTEVIDD